MTRTQQVGAAIAAAGILVLGYFAIQWFAPDDDERPAMIVKNGSITFENGPDKNGNQIYWKDGGDLTWIPDHPTGKPVTGADASFEGMSAACDLKNGIRFTLTYKEGNESEEFSVVAAGLSPKIFPKDLLVEDSPTKQRVGFGSGPSTLSVRKNGGKPCQVPANKDVTFTFHY